MTIRMTKFKGPRCFVQVGKYEGRNKRTQSTFRVIEGVELKDLRAAVEAAVNGIPKSAA